MAGRVREQNGKWHMVYQYHDECGKLRQKSKSTKLPVKGNKRKAEAMLEEWLKEMEKQSPKVLQAKEQLFLPFMKDWLDVIMPGNVRETTLAQYKLVYDSYIAKYKPFQGVTLKSLTPLLMQGYFSTQLQAGMSPNTVRKHYANIHKCLDHAVNMGCISKNPCKGVNLGKKVKYKAQPIPPNELAKVMQLFMGDPIEVPVMLALYFALRRSEACGLHWEDIDFDQNMIHICHTAQVVHGKATYIYGTKTEESDRFLPIPTPMRAYLLEVLAKQEENKSLFGSEYVETGLVCVKPDGTPIHPDFVTHHFQRKLSANGMKVSRFHDLRHSAVNLLNHNGVDIKDISAFLGHSEIGTTANIYGHLIERVKRSTTEKISEALPVAFPSAGSENPPTGVSRDVCQA